MGYEYNFNISTEDLKNLSRNQDGINDLDRLLRSAPYFIEGDGSTYTYSENSGNKDVWPANISLQKYGFCLCVYGQPLDKIIMDYLIYELLNRCGHVEVEDA